MGVFACSNGLILQNEGLNEKTAYEHESKHKIWSEMHKYRYTADADSSQSSDDNNSGESGTQESRRRCITQNEQNSESMNMFLALIPLIIIVMYLFKRFYSAIDKQPIDKDEPRESDFAHIL